MIHKNKWGGPFHEKVLLQVGLSLSIIALIYTICYYVFVYILYRHSLQNITFSNLLGSWVSSYLLFALWTTFYFVWRYVENSRYMLIKRLQLETEMKDMEIKTLRANLQPHFIFNSLNSIRALIDENPQLARTAITKISNILRNSISQQEATDTLQNELQLAQDYLDLEKIRFEERLQLFQHIDPQTLSYRVPTMILQTLVENSIKHGISMQESGGEIHINTSLNNNWLTIQVLNTGSISHTMHEHSLGFGLQASQKRLEHLFGPKATITISQQQQYVNASIQIPIQSPLKTVI